MNQRACWHMSRFSRLEQIFQFGEGVCGSNLERLLVDLGCCPYGQLCGRLALERAGFRPDLRIWVVKMQV